MQIQPPLLMNTLPRPQPLAVVILDGWGMRSETEGNPIAAAATPTIDTLNRHFPMTTIAASGLEVGLPAHIGGNSETGHRNIGAGKVAYQILASIDRAIADGTFFQNPALIGAAAHAKQHNSAVHLIGLTSRGGVHAQLDHLPALLKLLQAQQVRQPVYVHVITDGRDAPPRSGAGYVRSVEEILSQHGIGKIASVIGRFYAMDRNRNWERTREAYRLLVAGEHTLGSASAVKGIERAYQMGVTDEMLPPLAVTRGGVPLAKISNDDAVIFFNFRPDRSRQLTQAFVAPAEAQFEAPAVPNLYFATLGYFGAGIPAPAAFREELAEWPLARIISEAGLTQLHVAETEKYAHVTYYLNVGHEKPFAGEQHTLIPSAAVKDFADKPAMEAPAIAKTVVQAIQDKKFDVYFVNFANADMVGHTGDFAASIAACQVVDECVGAMLSAVFRAGGAMILTADHGNIEDLAARAGQLKTEHTRNPVPFYLARAELKRTVPRSAAEIARLIGAPQGVLADVAPTVLDVLRLKKPPTMTGVSLLGSIQ